MTAKTLVAAGFIIFRRFNSGIEYLLLQTSYGENHWTPPKGHVDPGESEIETAWRETKEEAGLTDAHLSLISNFQKTLRYDVRGVAKRVEYWLAELKNSETSVVLSDEHIHYEWLVLKQAQEYVKFKDMQETLQEADNFIKNIK